MVAYSFKKRFGLPILAGTKAQTIRVDRKRHARPGEELQLYTGMRTAQCRLLGRAPCLFVVPVRLCFSARTAAAPFEIGGLFLSWAEMEAFAQADGFANTDAMARFWWAEHPPEHGDTIEFSGVLIRWHLREIVEEWGSEPVTDLTAVDAQQAIDARGHTPSVARYYRAVLSKLLSFGVPRGFCPVNVIKGTEKVEHKPNPHKPWTDWAFEAFFEHARPGLHLPVYSALYTGQRSIDVIPMRRPAPGANAIELVARKTGANVFVPIHSEYREILTRTHIDHAALHLSEDGTPWTLAGYRTAWQRELTSVNAKGQPTQATPAKKAAMARIREAGFVFHGLRKNAVNMLLEAGNTEAEVSAIVEMSEQMVRHYSRDVNKRRLAVNGMRKLEEAWKETRVNLFGRSTH